MRSRKKRRGAGGSQGRPMDPMRRGHARKKFFWSVLALLSLLSRQIIRYVRQTSNVCPVSTVRLLPARLPARLEVRTHLRKSRLTHYGWYISRNQQISEIALPTVCVMVGD